MKKILIIMMLWPSLVCAAEPSLPDGNISLPHLTIIDAEKMWQHKNREIQQVRDQVAGVAADKLGAAQRPNPQLSLLSQAIGTGGNHRYLHGADTILRIDQPLERGGKRDLRMRRADFSLNAAQQDLADSLRQGRVALYQAYYDLELAQEKLQISEDNAHLFAQTVDAAKLRLNAGDIAKSELSRIQVDALRAENDVRQAQNDLQQAQTALAYQIGAEDDVQSIHAADHWPSVEKYELNTPDQIDQRPDVSAAKLRVQAAETARDLAQALKTRDVTVSAQIEHNGNELESNTIGLGVSIPLFTGYEYAGEIGRSEAEFLAAQDDLERIRAQARTEISRARSDLEAAAELLQRFDNSLLTEAASSLNSVEFAYQHGALSIIDLLDARRTYKATLLDASNAHANYAKALIAWRYANGQGEPQ